MSAAKGMSQKSEDMAVNIDEKKPLIPNNKDDTVVVIDAVSAEIFLLTTYHEINIIRKKRLFIVYKMFDSYVFLIIVRVILNNHVAISVSGFTSDSPNKYSYPSAIFTILIAISITISSFPKT